MSKSPDAFRTISEVADWLGVQAHVLRFWESKFSQVKPVKRAGGRRYYRPNDMLLLGGLKKLLHEDGLTIKGAQKMLRENSVAHVAAMSQPLDDLTAAVIDDRIEEAAADTPDPAAAMPDDIVTQAKAAKPAEGTSDPAPAETVSETEEPETAEPVDTTDVTEVTDHASETPEPAGLEQADDSEDAAPPVAAEPVSDSETAPDASDVPVVDDAVETTSDVDTETEVLMDADDPGAAGMSAEEIEAPEDDPPHDDPEEVSGDLPGFLRHPLSHTTQETTAEDAPREMSAAAPPTISDEPPQDNVLEHVPDTEPEVAEVDSAPEPTASDTSPDDVPAPAPAPRKVDIPAPPAESTMTVEPSALTALSRVRRLTPDQADAIRPLVARLAQLRADMSGPHKDSGKD
ncbi:MerR family transcriptional regulator [uncultured Roseobacter sp.]|uniref:MerR family transcriptional regulator n=1 Tax=uncultured Roseobacter sp. TaxID=114847 RepID=UPI0026169DE1|nr:MerR family transcriptional regulator [uncultured Roseobacter sp.]